MRFFLSICIFGILISCQAPVNQPDNSPNEEEWISLFNGKDMEGWTIKIAGRPLGENYLNTVVIEDSIFRISYDEYDQFNELYGHIYYHQPYSYYRLKFDYRFVGEQTPGGATWNVRNSGIMVHSQSAESVGYDQHFPVSIEVQLLGGLGEEDRTTGNLCTPGTRVVYKGEVDQTHCISSNSETYHGDQWVSMEAIVLGDEAVHHLIGKDTILSYEQPQIDDLFTGGGAYDWKAAGVPDGDNWKSRAGELLSEGYIALQAESHPIDFRNIQLLNLKGCMDKKAKNYKAYYVKAAKEECEY